MEKISWLDKVTNEEVLRIVNEDRQILNSLWVGDHFVVKPSTVGQPTWPTQPSIPQWSVNE